PNRPPTGDGKLTSDAPTNCAGRFFVSNSLVDEYGARVGAIPVAVYVVLARHAGKDRSAYPSYQRIASKLKISRRMAIKAVQVLMRAGLVEKRSQPRGRKGWSANLFVLRALGGEPYSPGGEPYSPPVVNHVHQGGEPYSPEGYTIKETQLKETNEGRGKKPAEPAPPPLTAQDFRSLWNKHVPFSPCKEICGERLKAFRARARDPTWCARYREALELIPSSDFLCGVNDRGWKISIDWFLKPTSMTKILE